jgi:hypothetical protein
MRERQTTIAAQGVLGWVSFDGQWVVIGKRGVGHIYKGERRFHVSQLSGVAVKAATRLHYGYLQVLLRGVTPAPVVRFGPEAGRPPMADDNSISFAKSANDDISQLRHAVEQAITAAHGHSQVDHPSAPASSLRVAYTSPATPASTDARVDPAPPPSIAAHAGEGDGPGGRSETGRLNDEDKQSGGRNHLERDREASPADPQDDYRRGEVDGAQAATRLPLAVLDSLIAHQFDVVRWLGPWRQYWNDALTRPGPNPVPTWLPEVARYLGIYAAPIGSTNSAFTPPPAYISGFCIGMRNAWNNAVASQLVPPDRRALARWLAQPTDSGAPHMPLAEATLADLSTVRKRARRAAVTRGALRVALWVITGTLFLMEIAAIAITIDGSWTDPDGTRSANQLPNAIGANLMCSIPLLALCTFIVLDLRRSRRRKAAEAVAQASAPPGGDGSQ